MQMEKKIEKHLICCCHTFRPHPLFNQSKMDIYLIKSLNVLYNYILI